MGQLAKVILDHEREYIDIVYYFSDLACHLPDVIANDLHSHISEKKVRWMAKIYRVPSNVHLLILRRVDTILNLPIGFCFAYLDQFKDGLRIPIIPLLMEILEHYMIALSQLVLNAIRVIVGFERFYRDKKVVTSLSLFRAFFYLKSSLIAGW